MVSEHTGARSIWSVLEAKEHFEEVLRLVGEGKTAAIVDDGRVVAELNPPTSEEYTVDERRAAVAKFLEARAKWKPTGVTREEILAWRHKGHRW